MPDGNTYAGHEKQGANMANKKQSKTDAIRDALKTTDSPTDVAAMLNKRGIKVSAQYVSTIKANDKRKAEAGAPSRKPGRPRKAASNGHAVAAPPYKRGCWGALCSHPCRSLHAYFLRHILFSELLA